MKSILAIALVLVIAGVLFGDLSLSVNMFNIGNSMSIASGAGTWSATQTASGGDLTSRVVGFFLVVIAVAIITRQKRRKGDKYDGR